MGGRNLLWRTGVLGGGKGILVSLTLSSVAIDCTLAGVEMGVKTSGRENRP